MASSPPTQPPVATRPPAHVTGVCPVIETPFTPKGDIDPDALGALVDHLGTTGIESVMYAGFASESFKLSDAERELLLATVIEHAHHANIRVVASIPDHATFHAVARARRSVELGADMINILPPHLLAPSASSILQHIRAVLDAVPTTPAILQFAPAQTGTALTPETITRLADDSPNLLQVKVESTPPGRLIAALEGSPLTSLVGYAGVQLPDALRRGAVGVQPGCSFTELYVSFWSLWESENIDAALDLHRRMLPYLSYWMQGVELIVAAEKKISAVRGLIPSHHCREPAHELDTEELAMIDTFLDEFHDELTATRQGQGG